MRSQGGRLADGYAGGGSGCGCPRVLRPGDLVLVGEQHVGQQHALKGVVANVAMPVESVSEVVAVLAIGSEVGDGDGARDVGEIALDALRRQAAGPIGVHHDRDVTVLEPEGPRRCPTPGRQERRGPASRRRARRSCRAGPRLSCGHLQEPVVPARSQRPLRRRAETTSEMALRAGSTERRQSRLRAPCEA